MLNLTLSLLILILHLPRHIVFSLVCYKHLPTRFSFPKCKIYLVLYFTREFVLFVCFCHQIGALLKNYGHMFFLELLIFSGFKFDT